MAGHAQQALEVVISAGWLDVWSDNAGHPIKMLMRASNGGADEGPPPPVSARPEGRGLSRAELRRPLGLRPSASRLASSSHSRQEEGGGQKQEGTFMNFAIMSCFFCSSDVGLPIAFIHWSYIIFSTVCINR